MAIEEEEDGKKCTTRVVEFEWGKLVRMCDDGGVERSKEESGG